MVHITRTSKRHVLQSRSSFQLINADCIKGLKKLPSGSVDVVVTSPPYNLGIKYRSYSDTLGRGDYIKWSLDWASEVHRILDNSGSFFLNVGASPSNQLLPHEMVSALTKDLFCLQNSIHWIKSIAIESTDGNVISRGHFKPISSDRFLNDCHEYVFHFTKGGYTPIDRLAIGVPYADKSNVSRWGHTNGRDKRCRGNTWFVPYHTIRNRKNDRPHPATFPSELAEKCILLHGITENTVVVDPFVGIGSSAIAAANTGVSEFIGFDIDPEYIKIAKQRLQAVS